MCGCVYIYICVCVCVDVCMSCMCIHVCWRICIHMHTGVDANHTMQHTHIYKHTCRYIHTYMLNPHSCMMIDSTWNDMQQHVHNKGSIPIGAHYSCCCTWVIAVASQHNTHVMKDARVCSKGMLYFHTHTHTHTHVHNPPHTHTPSTMSVIALMQNMGVLNKLQDQAIAAASISLTVASWACGRCCVGNVWEWNDALEMYGEWNNALDMQ